MSYKVGLISRQAELFFLTSLPTGCPQSNVSCDDAGHDRAVCYADVVQAGEVELDERLCASLLHLKVRLAGELDRPVAALGRRASRRHSDCHYSKGCIASWVLSFVFLRG